MNSQTFSQNQAQVGKEPPSSLNSGHKTFNVCSNLEACCLCAAETGNERLKEALSQNQTKRVPSLHLDFESSWQRLFSLTHKCSELTGWLSDRSTDFCGQNFASSSPSRSGGRIFFSWLNFLCWLLFGVCSKPMFLQWHMKEPDHFAKSTGGRLQINTHTPLMKLEWADYAVKA